MDNSFSNQQIGVDDQPKLSDIGFTSLAANYRATHMLTSAAFFLLMWLVASLLRFQPLFTLPDEILDLYFPISALVLGLAALVLLYQYFADPCKKYAIREQDIHYQYGLIFNKVISQPILRIQHIEIKRGPVERIAGLASLQVFSAGGAMHTFEIPGLAEDKASQIRRFILSHSDVNTHG